MPRDPLDQSIIKMRAYSTPWWGGVDLLISSGEAYCQKIEFEEYRDKGKRLEPSLSICTQDAQILMDDLWACGMRSTEGKGSAGSLKATENRLGDMRKIVFKQLKMDISR